MIGDDVEAGVFEHGQGGFAALALGVQVAIEEEAVGHLHRHRFQRPQVEFTSGGGAELGSRTDEAEQAEDAEAVFGGQVFDLGELIACDRQQEVHRDRVHAHLSQGRGDFDQFVIRLAHPGDQARTHPQAGALG